MASPGGDRAADVPGGPARHGVTDVRRRARPQIDSAAPPAAEPAPAPGRRLSDDERRLLHERRQQRTPEVPEPARAEQARTTAAHEGLSKPPPRMPKRQAASSVGPSGIFATGAVLLVVLLLLGVAGSRLLGSARSPGTGDPTASADEADPVLFPPPASTPSLAFLPTPAETSLPGAEKRAPVVCLDPGHGGTDRGFQRGPIGNLPSLDEATLTLQLAWDLEARLKQRGYTVVMTRRTDTSPARDDEDVNHDGKTALDDPAGTTKYGTIDDIQARINICNAAHADLLVSMHINGYSTSKPFGYETWYTAERPFGDENRAFAVLAYAHLKEQLAKVGYVVPAADERGVNPDSTADVQKQYTVFKHFLITGPEIPNVLKPSEMPGAIVETLFISNDGDASVLVSPEGQNAIVTAYLNAIVEYFERYPPVS